MEAPSWGYAEVERDITQNVCKNELAMSTLNEDEDEDKPLLSKKKPSKKNTLSKKNVYRNDNKVIQKYSLYLKQRAQLFSAKKW